MNRKDLKTLSESYEKIFENTIAGMLADESEDQFGTAVKNDLSNDVETPEEAPSDISIGVTGNDGTSSCSEVNDMNITKLRSLISHSNKILQLLQNGKEIEAWMTDKITVASENVLDVSNVLEFGN